MSHRNAFDDFEAAGWEAAADGYESFFGPITDRLIDPILDATQVSAGTRLLDIACGPGRLIARAAQRSASTTGLDVSQAMLHRARSAAPTAQFRHGDAQRLPFPDDEFDVVTASFAILHLSDPERAVAECARVLVPGGRIAVTVWDQPVRARLFGWITEALAAAGAAPPPDVPAGPDFFRFADDDELNALLSTNGFVETVVSTHAFAHPAPSGEAIWTGIIRGSVRTSAVINQQEPDVQTAARRAFDRTIAAATTGGGIEIPISVKLATARVGG